LLLASPFKYSAKQHFRGEVVRRTARYGEFQNRSIFVVVAFVLHFDEIIHTDHN
jgi:hypothetical protein